MVILIDKPIHFKDNLKTVEAHFSKTLRTTEAHFGFTGPYKKKECKPTQCKGTAVIKGILQDGMFDVLSHRVDAHHHEQSPCDFHLREFHSKFKNACREQVDTPVQQVYEDQKIAYATSLSEADRATFLTSLPPSKGSLMIGYRLVP